MTDKLKEAREKAVYDITYAVSTEAIDKKSTWKRIYTEAIQGKMRSVLTQYETEVRKQVFGELREEANGEDARQFLSCPIEVIQDETDIEQLRDFVIYARRKIFNIRKILSYQDTLSNKEGGE